MADRWQDYRDIAGKLNVDAVALVPGPNFTRAVGQSFMSHERPFVLIIPVSSKPVAIVPNLELTSWDLVGFEGTTFDWRDQTGYADAFAAMASGLPMARLAVEGQVMRVFVHHALRVAWPGAQIIDAEQEISSLRMIKTPKDIAALEEAIEISERALHRVLDSVRIGQTEKQIEATLIAALFAEGADDLAFSPIVAAGENSALPHAHARDGYHVRSGDALLFDFGARRKGFTADITRTVFVENATEHATAVYNTVLAANLEGHRITRAGITAHQVDDAVTGVLEASAYRDRIKTKTGHGLGRDVHEAPYIMRGNHQSLPAGTVFTNEPGLYKLGEFGVRIEDDALVTQDGCRSLTTFPKNLRIVGV